MYFWLFCVYTFIIWLEVTISLSRTWNITSELFIHLFLSNKNKTNRNIIMNIKNIQNLKNVLDGNQ